VAYQSRLDADLACAFALFNRFRSIIPLFAQTRTFALATHPFHLKVFGDSGGNDEVSSPFTLVKQLSDDPLPFVVFVGKRRLRPLLLDRCRVQRDE
jgi:hypothetical protein